MNSIQTAIANLFKIPVQAEKSGRNYGIRKYAGASTSTTGVQDWQASQTSADNEIWSSLRLLIARSRSLYQDDSNVQTAVDELVSLIVDVGINLQSKVKNGKGELNLKVNQEIEDKFNTWAWNRDWCDAAGRLTFWQMQSVIQHAVLIDGGILVRIVNKRFGRSPLPFALELIEIDQLDDRLNFGRANNGNEIRMGVEVDVWKRPVAYWILDDHPGDFYRKGSSMQSRRVPASEVFHIHNRQGWRPGQTRGVPQVHAGILKARNLLGLEENEVVKSRVQSCITAFIENEMPDFEPDMDEYGNVIKDLFPGAIEYLQPGQRLAPFVPSSPNPNLHDFVKHFQRSIAGLFGLSSHSVTRDLSDANYSSLREGKLNEWRRVGIYRDQLNEDFNSPIFHRWLDLAVQFKFVKVPGDYEEKKEEKYYCDYWFGAPMPWVDPMKDMQSTKLEIEMGLTTRSRVLAAVGVDFEEILQEKAKEDALMKQYGVEGFGEDTGEKPEGALPDGEDPGAPAPLIEGMQAVRDVAIAAIKSASDIQVRTVEAVPVEVKDIPAPVEASEPDEPIEININLGDYLPTEDSEPVEVGEVYPLLPGMTRAIAIDGERKIKAKKKKNCANGQVCGFSCISKTKVCKADMTTAQLMEHNKAKKMAAAEKRKAAKGGAGAATQTGDQTTQDAGGNTVVPKLLDIADMTIAGNINEDRAQKIAQAYLEGQVPLRPVITKSAGIDQENFAEKFEAIDRQDEARAHQIANSKDKFYELAPALIVTPKNEAFVNEQLALVAGIKREIPESTAPKSQPFDHTKQAKNPRSLFDIDSVKGDDLKLSDTDTKLVESLAQNYLKGGNIDPIILKRTGINKETFAEEFSVESGKLEFSALRRAKEIDPKFELFSGIVMDATNEKNIVDQLKLFYQ